MLYHHAQEALIFIACTSDERPILQGSVQRCTATDPLTTAAIATPTMQTLICPVQTPHIPDLLRLLRAKAAFDGAENTLQATEENLAQELFASHANVRAIVATVDHQVVGMATYFQTFSSFLMKPGLWLDDLYVDSEYRKHGVGKQLITWLCKEAASHGCARIDWIVEASNDNARGFYERMGATIFENLRLARIDHATIVARAGDA